MAKWFLVRETNCTDPAREEEFNRWYNEIHVPDALKVPGFRRATRYENIAPAQGEAKFLAIYEIESEDIDKTMADLQDAAAKMMEQGRITELVVKVSPRTYKQSIYKQIYP